MALPPQPWPTGEVDELEPLVRRVLAPNGSPFTYTGTQTYLVGSDEGLTVIDPGPAEDEHLSALVSAISGAPVRAASFAPTRPSTNAMRPTSCWSTASRSPAPAGR